MDFRTVQHLEGLLVTMVHYGSLQRIVNYYSELIPGQKQLLISIRDIRYGEYCRIMDRSGLPLWGDYINMTKTKRLFTYSNIIRKIHQAFQTIRSGTCQKFRRILSGSIQFMVLRY